MTMYNTILEAFKNGSGDVFFTKEEKYIAVSRKDDLSYYFDNGYEFMTYEKIIETDKLQKGLSLEKTIKVSPVVKQEVKHIKMVDNSHNYTQCYYDEFPDAYGQNL